MGRQRSCRGCGQPCAAQPATVKEYFIGSKIKTFAILVTVVLAEVAGCSSNPSAVSSDPPAKIRLGKLVKFYNLYTNQHKKPPPNEQAFKEYIRSLPQDEKDAAGVGEDVDSYLVSPGDGKKYHIEYGLNARPGGPNRALAWEETGKDGQRYVALTMGYVVPCDEESFQNYKKKK
jgi:hypothetical protein